MTRVAQETKYLFSFIHIISDPCVASDIADHLGNAVLATAALPLRNKSLSRPVSPHASALTGGCVKQANRNRFRTGTECTRFFHL